jgi:hypothetical protein
LHVACHSADLACLLLADARTAAVINKHNVSYARAFHLVFKFCSPLALLSEACRAKAAPFCTLPVKGLSAVPMIKVISLRPL